MVIAIRVGVRGKIKGKAGPKWPGPGPGDHFPLEGLLPFHYFLIRVGVRVGLELGVGLGVELGLGFRVRGGV